MTGGDDSRAQSAGSFGFRYDPDTGVAYLNEEDIPPQARDMTEEDSLAATEAIAISADRSRSMDERLAAVNDLRTIGMITEAEAGYIIGRLYAGKWPAQQGGEK